MRASGATSRRRTDVAIQWLLDGDPAIRWQALRDLVEAAERTVERGRVGRQVAFLLFSIVMEQLRGNEPRVDFLEPCITSSVAETKGTGCDS